MTLAQYRKDRPQPEAAHEEGHESGGHAHPGALRLAVATLLELTPGQWRYRGVAVGDVGAALHAVAWVGIGLVIAEWRAARLGRSAG